jgi:hypothetical protein
MDCKISEREEQIIDFHFGNLSGAERDSVEQHLSQCSTCLATYFSLKREMEVDAKLVTPPSESVRNRIMAEFEAYSYSIWSSEGGKWIHAHRRTLLVGGILAAAATLLLIFSSQNQFIKSSVNKVVPSERFEHLDEAIDSARQSPVHINTI